MLVAFSAVAIGGVVRGLKGKMDQLTGGRHSRLVWTQEWGRKLVGYDTEADAVQVICTGEEILRPVFTSGGRRIVFSDQGSTYVINWDGGNKKLVSAYPCSDAWTDPSTGVDYAYVQTAWGADEFGDCFKVNCDDPTDTTLLLHSRFGNGDMSWYQVSSDGRLAVDYLPWGGGSAGGGYVIKDGGYKRSTDRQLFGGGCWSTVEKSTNYIVINLQCCPHRGGDVTQFYYNKRGNALEEQIGKFTFTGDIPEGLKQGEWMLPKFASKGERIICVVGGYGGTPKGNGRNCYIYRFTESYTDFDAWFQFTDGDYPNQWPDAWIDVEQPGPAIGIPVREITFEQAQNEGAPAPQTVVVSGTTVPLEGVTVESDVPWLQVSWNGSQITNTVEPAGLEARVHMGRVTIKAANASPRENSYLVYLRVMGPPVPDFIRITPFYGIVDTMSSIRFSAVVEDQYGQPLANQPASFEWKNEGWRVRSFDTETATLYTSESGGIKPIKCTAQSEGVTLTEKGYALVIKNYDDPGASPPTAAGIKINCGGPAEGDWESDEAYLVSGRTGAVMSIEGAAGTGGVYEPAPAAIYASARRGDHSYSFPAMTDGTYTVRLHLCDPIGGNRSMAFTVEQKTGISNLDIVAEAGQTGKALVKEIRVDVTDGNGLQIDALKLNGDDVLVSGIEVKPGLPDYYINITAPGAGETYKVGETVTIRWEAGAKVGGVVIEASVDNGRNWLQLIQGGDVAPGTIDWLAYPWTIPADFKGTSLVSNSVLVRVYDYARQDVEGVSTAFAIEAKTAAADPSSPRLRTDRIDIAGNDLRVRSSIAGAHSVIVYRIDGRAVLKRKTGIDGELRIPLSNFGKGAYFVILYSSRQILTRSITILDHPR